MARKPRNFRAEYQRRIASGLRRGQTRKEARGHAGDLTKSQKAAGAMVVKRDLEGRHIPRYLSGLGEGRRVKIIVAFEDGRYVTLIGKKGGQRPEGVRRRLQELIDEYGSVEAAASAAEYVSGSAMVTSINVVYA